MHDYFGQTLGRFDSMYYWEQFQPIISAVLILILGWILALLISAGVKKLLNKINTNQHLSSATGKISGNESSLNYESLLAKLVFWFILIIAIIAALNILNISSVSGPLSSMVAQVLLFIPHLIAAAIVAFVGWLLANLVRSALTTALSKTELDEKLSSEVGVSQISKNIAEIVYWLILLLFLPIVLSILKLNGLLAPVQQMVNDVITFLPQLFISAVIVFVGYIIAKILRGIVEGLSNSLSLQQNVEKIGLFKNSSISTFLGTLVFTVVIITTLIIAFEALGIHAISDPATNMLNQILFAIPNIIAAALILIFAYVVARLIARLITEVLSGTGIDSLPEKIGLQRLLNQQKLSVIIGYFIVFFTMLFAVSEAAHRIGLDQVSDLIAMFIHFGANILFGAVILVIGFWLANLVAETVQRGSSHNSKWLANLVRILIMGLVLAMGLRAMGIADSIVNLAFGLTLGAVAVAFALAFGLGGRQPAERVLNRFLDEQEKNCDKSRTEPVALLEQKPAAPESANESDANTPDQNTPDQNH
ncbi:mechanosensitive ion channel [Acinetobacter larvae]|uniref:Small-conductance mechanosensitive channel n=1 Tax=Acinetobacter larvae TaxID=1789224 RepID=A0A1B2LWS0_9GAMM|nr:mechanosensitive ion channel [Acinetobacter larvae]AOA57390.1 hypothetical protein BFG52_02780 [Acinetobacter larvae]